MGKRVKKAYPLKLILTGKNLVDTLLTVKTVKIFPRQNIALYGTVWWLINGRLSVRLTVNYLQHHVGNTRLIHVNHM